MKPSPAPSKTFSSPLVKQINALPPEQRAKLIRAASVLLASKAKKPA